MKFFIDTANLAQIQEANELGILDGVTTNPSLMAKEGIKGHEGVMNHYKTICELVDGDISAEVISTTFEEMIEEGKKRKTEIGEKNRSEMQNFILTGNVEEIFHIKETTFKLPEK